MVSRRTLLDCTYRADGLCDRLPSVATIRVENGRPIYVHPLPIWFKTNITRGDTWLAAQPPLAGTRIYLAGPQLPYAGFATK